VGIAPSILELLLAEHKERPLRGRAIVLGLQYVTFGADYLAQRTKAHGVQLADTALELSQAPSLAARRCVSDVYLFRSLGCDSLDSLDFDGREGATLIHDLNRSEIPEDLKGRFDVVYDGGTLEHVFNVPNALLCIHDLLAPGGRIIHSSPMHNWVDHGFIQLCPAFFVEYYGWNLYHVHTLKLHRADLWDFTRGFGTVHEYDPAHLMAHHYGAFDSGIWGIWFTATRTPSATRGRTPVQGRYVTFSLADPTTALDHVQAAGISRVWVYGAGSLGRDLLHECRARGVEVAGFVDSDSSRLGQRYEGLEICGMAGAMARGSHTYLIASVPFMREIADTIFEAHARTGQPCRVFPPMG